MEFYISPQSGQFYMINVLENQWLSGSISLIFSRQASLARQTFLITALYMAPALRRGGGVLRSKSSAM